MSVQPKNGNRKSNLPENLRKTDSENSAHISDNKQTSKTVGIVFVRVHGIQKSMLNTLQGSDEESPSLHTNPKGSPLKIYAFYGVYALQKKMHKVP